MIEIGNRRKTSKAVFSKIDIYAVCHSLGFLEPFFRTCVDSVMIDSEGGITLSVCSGCDIMTAVIRVDKGDCLFAIAAFEVPSFKIPFAVHFFLRTQRIINRIPIIEVDDTISPESHN